MNTTTTDAVYEAVIGDNTVTAANCAGILNHVPGLEGYAHIPDTDEGAERAFTTLLDHAYNVARTMQEGLAAAATNDGRWDPAEAVEDELTAILGDRRDPISLDGPWQHPVPLVLVASHYAPVTDTPVPAGDVILLDPADELIYLKSLDRAGLIKLTQLVPSDDAD